MKRTSLIIGGTLAVCLVSVVIATEIIFPHPTAETTVRGGSSNASAEVTSTKLIEGVTAQQQEQIESELITVSRFGFMPLAIKRSAKDFVMTIVNRTADPELNLTLNRTVGNRPTDKVIDVKLKKGRGSWNAHFNLPPGDYELSEASHPEWKCTITLTPR
ncbi:MAG: hypothetical protein KA368_16275 [Acidobacteria bacterium]|nr:hypothetical protein [Acidobacteriota bacterium]